MKNPLSPSFGKRILKTDKLKIDRIHLIPSESFFQKTFYLNFSRHYSGACVHMRPFLNGFAAS